MAKRNLTADRPTNLRGSTSPKAQEQELEAFMAYMIEQTAERFRNQVFGALNQSTVEKFADATPEEEAQMVSIAPRGFPDAQIGNYAAVYLRLANQVRRKLLKQFDDKRIETLVASILGKVNSRGRQELYDKVEKRIGLSTKELTATEGLSSQINALILETSEWVKKTLDDTLAVYTTNSLHAMTTGASIKDVVSQFDDLVEKRRNHAKFTARNQVANFNSITTKLRAQNLGITMARWITAHDERVRASHSERDGKEFDLAEGLYSSVDGKTLLPGVDYQCRCTYELIIPEDNS